MRTRPTILFFSPEACPVPALVRQWAATNTFPLLGFSQPEEVEAIVLRGHPCLLFVDGNGAVDRGVRPGPPAQAGRLHRHRAGDGARRRPPRGAGPGLVRGRGGRGGHRHLLAGRAACEAGRDAGADRAGRVGPPVHPAPGHHGDRARDPPPAGVGSGVRGVLRGPGPFQGIQRSLQLLRRRPGHLSALAHSPRRREGHAGPARVRRAHRGRRLHLRHPDRGDQRRLQRDPRRVRHPRFRCSTTTRTGGRGISSGRTAGASSTGCR